MPTSPSPSTTPAAALRRVLAATREVEQALDPLDVATLDRALAARAQALVELVPAEPEASEELAALAAETAEADRRLRARAAQGLENAREELRALASGRSGLDGYRPPVPNLPRFADRRG